VFPSSELFLSKMNEEMKMEEEWEYEIVPIRVENTEERRRALRRLNEIGKDGWELVSQIKPTDNYDVICFFKRKKNPNPSFRK